MEGTLAYGLLDYYLRTHFELPKDITVAAYIDAVMNNNGIATLIRCFLRPVEKYDAVSEYRAIFEALISA